MKIYYINQEYEAGKRRIVAANFDRDDFSWKNTINVPYSVLGVDEVEPENKGICFDLVRSCGRIDLNGQGKYYVGNDGNLYEVEGWEEYVELVEE